VVVWKAGLTIGDAEVGVGEEEDVRGGVDGGDQALDVGLEAEAPADVFEDEEELLVLAERD
jgi:hypothetical protein